MEGGSKLVLRSMPEGEYELLVYAHQSLSNVKATMVKSFDALYSMRASFLHWNEVDDFKSRYIMIQIDGEEFKAPLVTVDPSLHQCMQDYSELPDSLISLNGGVIAVNEEFSIPEMATYEHTMTYTPAKG